MKRFFLILLIIILAGAAGVGIAVMRLDAQSVRDQVAEAVRGATGKPLIIREMPELSLMPLGVRFGAAYWGLAPDGTSAPGGGISAAVKGGQVSVQFMPLFSGRVVVHEVRLDSPDIRIAETAAAPGAPETSAKQGPPPAGAQSGPIPPGLEIAELSITNGSLALDTGAGTSVRLSKLNLSLSNLKAGEEMRLELSTDLAADKPALEGAITLAAKARLQAARCELSELSTRYTPRSGLVPAALGAITLTARGAYDLNGDKIALDLLKLAAQAASLDLSGEADLKTRAFNGKAAVDGSPRRLAQAFGVRLPVKKGLESFKLQSPLVASERAIALGSIRGMLDSTSIAGALNCEPGKMHIGGNLRFGALDVDALNASGPFAPEAVAGRLAALLGPSEAHAAAKNRPTAAGAQQRAAPRQGAQAAQGKQASGNVSGLPSADLDLAIASVTAAKLRFNDISARIRGRGVYRAEPLALNLGTGGTVRLNISVDADAMRCTVSGKISNVAVGPLLQAVQGKRPVDGTADADLNGISFSGTSDKAIRASLAGRGLLTVRGIVLNGVSILPKGAPAGLGNPPTHFERLTVPFAADNGQIALAPVSLSSPALNAGGKGMVRLPQETMEFAGDIKLLGLTLPVAASGPFNDISYGLDGKRAMEGLAKNSGAILEGAKDLGLTGGKKAGSAAGRAAEGATRGAGKVLRGILRP